MLQVIRERAQGLIVWIIVGFIIVTFALWGVGEYFREDPPIYVAKVNDEPILQIEYQRVLQQERDRLQQMFQGVELGQFEEQLKKQALERLIDRKLIVQAAREAGLTVSDAQLAAVLRGIEAFHDENGQFSPTLYEQRLRAFGYSTTAFEDQLRADLLAEQLVDGITVTAFATARDVAQAFQLQEQRRDVGFVLFPPGLVQDQVELSEEEIEAYYQQHQSRYQVPEQVKAVYLRLRLEDLLDRVEVSEEEVRRYYERHPELYTVPEQRRIAHILVAVPEEGDEAEARAKAEELYRRLQEGADFAELAKSSSDDPGSAPQGGDLGFLEKGLMDPEFDEVAFTLPPGQVSEPVRTAFGYHLIKVLEVKSGETKPFEAVRGEIERELRREKAEKLFLDEQERLANQAFEYPDSLEPAAEALGLEIQESDWVSRAGGEGIFAQPKVLEALFADEVLKEGYNSEPVELSRYDVVVLRVRAHRPAEVRPLEEVRAQVEAALRQEKAAALLAERAAEFERRVRAGEDPAEVAQALGGRWVRESELGRAGAASVPPEVVRTAFRLPRPQSGPSVGTVALSGGAHAAVVVFAVRDPDPAQLDEETRRRYAEALRQAFGGDEFNAVLNALKAEAEIERYEDRL